MEFWAYEVLTLVALIKTQADNFRGSLRVFTCHRVFMQLALGDMGIISGREQTNVGIHQPGVILNHEPL